MFRWKDKTKHSLELLFVRRCVNEKDAWSGQVAFPGGRRQKQTGTINRSWGRDDGVSESTKWESLCETAQRETKEEVGLDLTLPYVIESIGSLAASVESSELRSLYTHVLDDAVAKQIRALDWQLAATSDISLALFTCQHTRCWKM